MSILPVTWVVCLPSTSSFRFPRTLTLRSCWALILIEPDETLQPSLAGFCLSDFYIIQKWIDYAKGLKDQSVKEIAHKAINKKTGARGLRSILENILLKTMYDLPSKDDVEEVIIDSGAAKGQSQPIVVHTKNNNKSKTDKTSAA